MRKFFVFIITMLFVQSSVFACLTGEPKPGDIIVYRPTVIQMVPGVKLPTEIFEKRCNQKIQFHADLYVGGGWVMTSTPNQGCGAVAKLDDRIDSGTWSDVWIYRHEGLTESDINEIMVYADNLECNYDWIGYYEWLVQMVCSCGEKRPFTNLWNTIQELLPPALRTYHCVSSSFEYFNADPQNPRIPKPHSSIPTDLPGLGFALIETCEIH